jgi:hypothetical protein
VADFSAQETRPSLQFSLGFIAYQTIPVRLLAISGQSALAEPSRSLVDIPSNRPLLPLECSNDLHFES